MASFFTRIFLLFSILGVLSKSFGNSSNHSHFIDENGCFRTGYNSNGQIETEDGYSLVPVKIVDGNLSRVSVIQSLPDIAIRFSQIGRNRMNGINDSGQRGWYL